MKCLCGQKMKRPPLPFDIWGQPLWECDSCGAVMKQVVRGDPEKWTFIFWQILYLFGVHKKWWIKVNINVDNAKGGRTNEQKRKNGVFG